jgi:acetylglutamate kinase
MMNTLLQAAPHVRLQRDRIVVVKVGGSSLAKRRHLDAFVAQLSTVHALGARPVVVHGGGPQADALMERLGESPKMIDGRRVTTPAALDAVRMASAGSVNGELAAALTAAGAPAVGMCAAAGGLVTARRRPPIGTSEGSTDFGLVGDIQTIDPTPLHALLDAGQVPVVCPPVGDGTGGFLNLNADTLAAQLAAALGAAKLVLVTGAAGILRDPADPHSVVSVLTLAELRALGEGGSYEAGMRVKATAIEAALTAGVDAVHVIGGKDPQALLVELYTNHGAGTMVTREGQAALQEAGA